MDITDPKFLEFIGFMIGDGCILWYPQHRVYGIEICGHATDDRQYFERMAAFIEVYTSKKVRLERRAAKSAGNSIRIVQYNKSFARYLVSEIGLLHDNKTKNAQIPQKLLAWEYSQHIMRGIFEADGCIFFSKSKVIPFPSYPRMEITTVSTVLATQLYELLTQQGFRAQKKRYDNKGVETYVVYVSGPEQLEEWVTRIGFSSERHVSKYQMWKKFKYYIPNLTLTERQALLNAQV